MTRSMIQPKKFNLAELFIEAIRWAGHEATVKAIRKEMIARGITDERALPEVTI
jgi:hypothetical protein